MSFLSVSFAAALALVLIAFHAAPANWRPRILLGVSLAFYCASGPWQLLVLLGATLLAYAVAVRIERARSDGMKLHVLMLGVSVLVLGLVGFKCALSVAVALSSDGPDTDLASLAWLAAPLGLSYYSFKLIGYLLDVYWAKIPARRDFGSLALYASFFPQIVSGPIQRAGDFFGQSERLERSDPQAFVTGLRRILFGLFKKIVVADQLAVAVTHAHQDPATHSTLELLIGAYGYSLQMYADFSGITDIAIGIGLLFGLRGPENFNRPYFAANLQDFWRRWHMSLTSWLTDYLFVPLQMTFRRLGTLGLSLAIFVNMVAVGIWHGPRWTYLVFGCLNGAMMIVSALTLKRRNAWFRSHPRLATLRRIGGPLLTFHLVVLTHVFFQASDLHSAIEYLAAMLRMLPQAGIPAWRLDPTVFGLSGARWTAALAGLAAVEWIHWAALRPAWCARFANSRPQLRWAAYWAVAVFVILSAKGTTSFIYAKF